MGNIFLRKTEIEQPLYDAEVAQRLRGNETNNLELYLNDVYEKECVFKASEEEVEFIQTGIETLVQKIVDLVIEDSLPTLESVCDKIEREDLVEAYFNINKRDENFPQVKTTRSEIIKVGSFYEGTKNSFPDEFDFIFPLFHARKEIFPKYMDIHEIHSSIQKVTLMLDNKQSLMFISNELKTFMRKLYFNQFLRVHGPASMLRFIYINCRGEKRNIHVDLVPAYRVTPYDIESCLESTFTYHLHFCAYPKYFKKEILSTGTCLSVNNEYSFTETEVHFMKNMLSEKHRKVYRILKFLINGHGDGEIFKLVITGWYNSTYFIKVQMIEHHKKCQNSHKDNIRGCVINILEQMIHNDYRSNLTINNLHFPIINKLILRLIQLATKSTFSYDQVRMKSVSRQCLDCLDRSDKYFAFWFRYLDTLGEDDPSMDSFEQFLDAEIPGWRRERFKSLTAQFKPKKKSCLVM